MQLANFINYETPKRRYAHTGTDPKRLVLKKGNNPVYTDRESSQKQTEWRVKTTSNTAASMPFCDKGRRRRVDLGARLPGQQWLKG